MKIEVTKSTPQQSRNRQMTVARNEYAANAKAAANKTPVGYQFTKSPVGQIKLK